MKMKRLNSWLKRPFVAGPESSQRGMSLIEIIIVIALMGTLMAIVITNLTGRQDTALEDASRLAMQQLDTNLQMYKVHNYTYPTTDQGLDALVTAPSGASRWRGPYTEAKKLNDAWGQKFEYESDGRTFKIKSGGIDQQMGTADDVTYPAEDGPAKETATP